MTARETVEQHMNYAKGISTYIDKYLSMYIHYNYIAAWTKYEMNNMLNQSLHYNCSTLQSLMWEGENVQIYDSHRLPINVDKNKPNENLKKSNNPFIHTWLSVKENLKKQ